MDCVGCGRCRLWGKLQVQGLASTVVRGLGCLSVCLSACLSGHRAAHPPLYTVAASITMVAGAGAGHRAAHPLRARPAGSAALFSP
eukprot:scaffold39414_cov39-Phaeocystis_antarctica.AAC.1